MSDVNLRMCNGWLQQQSHGLQDLHREYGPKDG